MLNHVIVTGGTGVTGNALVRYLLQQNIKVTALIRPGSFRRHSLPENDERLTIVECGMDQYGDADCLLDGQKYDAFFHLSWDGSTGKEKVDNRNNFKLQNQNVAYAVDAVELCHRLNCPVFVMTGSQAEYGRKNEPVTETMEKHPENGYGMAKLCAEGMTRLLCHKYGIKHIWPILFSVYGPNDGTQSLVDVTLHKVLRGESADFTQGIQLWDYLYSYDAAKALMLLAERGRDGEYYNVGNGNARPIKDYITIMYNTCNTGAVPGLGKIPYGSGQVMSLQADISKLVADTGFSPEYTFEDGIRAIVDQIKKE